MKLRNSYFLISFGLILTLFSSCKKRDFVELNTNPNTLYSIEPQEQFLNAIIQMQGQDFEAYYDYYRRIMPWMQMTTDLNGNSKTFISDIGNFNQRYSIFYPGLGTQLADLKNLIALKPAAERPAYVYISAISDILKVYYSFYVSDINGSVAYSEAFQGKYGGTLTPKFESQQELFTIWENTLKSVITTLKTSQSTTQISLGNNDLYYHGETVKWIRAANALRLRIALRLSKRDETAAKAVFTSILSDQEQMASNNDSWTLYANQTFTSGGNWDITTFRAPRPTVDYMWKNSDPRIRTYYQKNNYTQANLNAAIAAGIYPAGTVWNPRQIVGAPISPDSASGKYKSLFQAKKVSSSLSLDTISYLNFRMWQPSNNGGTGVVTLPVITYADYCLMRAEIAAKGYATTGGTAEEWYNKGITASITFFDDAANKAKIVDYTALGATEISDYLNAPDVKFNASKALEQIAIQAYINFYKQPNEAWALYKRTGMPNSSTALKLEDIVIDGTVKQIPRRAALSIPATTDLNYANKQAALTDMAKDPGFGNGPTDVYGRVWWDKP